MVPLDAAPSPLQLNYTPGQRNTVLVLVICGIISLVSVLGLFVLIIFEHKKKYRHTHFLAYFLCLCLANIMQNWGTIMSLKWVISNEVVDGSHCYAQGGIKQGGNIAAALWSFVISFHLFNLLFLRYQTSRTVSLAIIAFGWSFVFMCVFLGPVAIQSQSRGHYFGISGLWCWITPAYRSEQILLEYLVQFLSVGLSFVLHLMTFLRVRGNLLHTDGRWNFRGGASWKLALGRDYTDSAMLGLVQHMVWYPIAFAATILPAAIARIPALCGMADVPLWVQAVTGAIYDLSGLVNVLLYLGVKRLFPEPEDTPEFTVDRTVADTESGASKDEIVKSWGVTPFLLVQPTKHDLEASSPERPNQISV
ncbi:hypothetical protein MIND_01373200 [Mycena indigotica]|uniref:Glucose receptor Git3 N-terminal domain-containing protein n=1 Tax=Mycena indigotica TaxID=2126181 RepID=A0A8H6VQH5_9AGAR|nr:uncharacterized protein MIND_01373200 [Mycena indigotica]KAF7289979.1 hypothetical protein MIND_01373200 [Mycena indigotica]